MSRNGLYILLCVFIVIVAGFGIYTFREETKPGVELKLNEDGVSLKQN